MFGIGFTEIILIAVLAVVVLGPDKLPQLGKTLARLLSEFNKLKRDFRMTITDIERVGEKAAGDISEDLDTLDLDAEDGEDIEFVAEDIDEVPESFEPERKRRPRRRRRTPGKAKVSEKPGDSGQRGSSSALKIAEKAGVPGKIEGKADVSEKADTSVKNAAPEKMNAKVDAKAEVPSGPALTGPLPTPEGTRQAAALLGAAKPEADSSASKPRRRRRPAAGRDKASSRATVATKSTGAASAKSESTANAKSKDTARAKPSRTAKSLAKTAVDTDAADTNTKDTTVATSEKKPAKSRTSRKKKVAQAGPEPETDTRPESASNTKPASKAAAVAKPASKVDAESSEDLSQSSAREGEA